MHHRRQGTYSQIVRILFAVKIFLLSDATSIHTQRWVASLAQRGCHILLYTLLEDDYSFYNNIPQVEVRSAHIRLKGGSALSQRLADKMVYLGALCDIRRQIRRFKPDIVHAHYACSFGLLGALAAFHPYVLSLWGSDVYDYPQQGRLYNRLLRYTLRRADYLLSTSYCMARETSLYTTKPITITPFGVDMTLFVPQKSHEDSAKRPFVVGNVKALKECYGIDTLIRAFALLCQRNPDREMLLKIAGTGPDKEALVHLCAQLGVTDRVEFLGYVPNQQLPALYSSFDVAVSLSRRESFGVVAVEAMSCQCPVVTSNAEGFSEVVADGETGFIVPIDDAVAAATAIQRLVDDPALGPQMGIAGRRRVAENYDWQRNVDTMMDVYDKVYLTASTAHQ